MAKKKAAKKKAAKKSSKGEVLVVASKVKAYIKSKNPRRAQLRLPGVRWTSEAVIIVAASARRQS